MTIPKATRDDIESLAFLTRTTTASSVDGLLRNIAEDPAFQALLSGLGYEFPPEDLLERLLSLASQSTNDEYANRFDVALSAYLLALSIKAPTLLEVASGYAAQAERTWWSVRVAARLQQFDSQPLATLSHSEGALEGIVRPILAQPYSGGTVDMFGEYRLRRHSTITSLDKVAAVRIDSTAIYNEFHPGTEGIHLIYGKPHGTAVGS